jgi:hypothetical protein
MKQLISLLVIVVITGCSKSNYPDSHTLTDTTIIDGYGIGSFEIDKTTANAVIKKLGRQFDEIRYKDYSIQMLYRDLGVSFYYMQQDNTQEIFSIVFTEPFKGRTSKGIVLGESTMEDVVTLYGEPDWTTCDNCETWTSEYKGIQFRVEREMSLPQFPLDEQVHLKKRITEIEITND